MRQASGRCFPLSYRPRILRCRPLFSFEGKLELTCRENESGQYIFVINHGDSEGRVLLDKDGQAVVYRDLLRDKEVSGSFAVASGEVAVLYREKNK